MTRRRCERVHVPFCFVSNNYIYSERFHAGGTPGRRYFYVQVRLFSFFFPPTATQQRRFAACDHHRETKRLPGIAREGHVLGDLEKPARAQQTHQTRRATTATPQLNLSPAAAMARWVLLCMIVIVQHALSLSLPLPWLSVQRLQYPWNRDCTSQSSTGACYLRLGL
jgi:hypothetical protein